MTTLRKRRRALALRPPRTFGRPDDWTVEQYAAFLRWMTGHEVEVAE